MPNLFNDPNSDAVRPSWFTTAQASEITTMSTWWIRENARIHRIGINMGGRRGYAFSAADIAALMAVSVPKVQPNRPRRNRQAR